MLFEELFEAITLHREFSGENVRLEPSTLLLNKNDTCDGYVFNIDVFTDEINALQKESLVFVVSRLKIYRTYILLARLTKVRR